MRRIDKKYWEKRIQKLDLARGESLALAQKVLDSHYPGKTRAKSLNNDTLKVVTPSAVMASELRLNQVKLLAEINQKCTQAIAKLQIQISQLK